MEDPFRERGEAGLKSACDVAERAGVGRAYGSELGGESPQGGDERDKEEK